MSYIIHPWNLLVFFLVASVAAMTHSIDDKDARSVSGDHPKPSDDTNALLHFAGIRKRHVGGLKRTAGYSGNFEICIRVAQGLGGTYGNLNVSVVYASGRTWGSSARITHSVWAGFKYCAIKERTYYGRSDPVLKVIVKNDHSWDHFNFRWVSVNGPERNDCFVCNWSEQCEVKEHPDDWTIDISGCNIVDNEEAHVYCGRLQEADCPVDDGW